LVEICIRLSSLSIASPYNGCLTSLSEGVSGGGSDLTLYYQLGILYTWAYKLRKRARTLSWSPITLLEIGYRAKIVCFPCVASQFSPCPLPKLTSTAAGPWTYKSNREAMKTQSDIHKPCFVSARYLKIKPEMLAASTRGFLPVALVLHVKLRLYW